MAELVGLDDVEVVVEVLFPVTLRFKQICFTRMPNAIFHISKLDYSRKEKRKGGRGRKRDALSRSAVVQVEEFCRHGTTRDCNWEL